MSAGSGRARSKGASWGKGLGKAAVFKAGRELDRAQIGIRNYLRGAQWQPVDDLARLHAQLTMPVRFVWGVDDPTFPIETALGVTRIAGVVPSTTRTPRTCSTATSSAPT